MRGAVIVLLFLFAGCGGQPPAAPISPLPPVSPQSTPAAEADTAAAGALAIALEGDVEPASETEYRSKGPEIRCSAMLVVGGVPQPVATEVEWTAEPDGVGVFSSGAHGVFFVPEGSGRVEIHAALKSPEGAETVSPKVILIVP
jgi:hypothetical protein